MKNIFFSFLIVSISFVKLFSQSITLTFNGTPETPDQILIENLTNNTSTTLTGSNTITLTAVSINNIEKENIVLFPNPFIEKTNLIFNIKDKSEITVFVYDQLGQLIINKKHNSLSNKILLTYYAPKSGVYFINIKGKNINISSSVLCNQTKHQKPELLFSEVNISKSNFNKNENDLTFSFGDILKYTGFYSNYTSIITDTPTISKTYNFNFISCVDFENNNYPIVKIGNQWWMAENLKSTKYSDGANISGNYVYNNNSANENIYGRLYTWAAVMRGASGTNNNPSNVQGVCPTGWHVPSEIEWDEMRDALGGWELMHGKLKETGTSHWIAPNDDATNESGMTITPGGTRFDDGNFQYLGEQAFFWNATDDLGGTDIEHASGYTLFSELPSASYYIYTWNFKTMAQSVRCVLD